MPDGSTLTGAAAYRAWTNDKAGKPNKKTAAKSAKGRGRKRKAKGKGTSRKKTAKGAKKRAKKR